MASRDISHNPPATDRIGPWPRLLPKMALGRPGPTAESGLTVSIGAPAVPALLPPPFRLPRPSIPFRRLVLPVRHMLALSADDRDRTAAAGAPGQSAATAMADDATRNRMQSPGNDPGTDPAVKDPAAGADPDELHDLVVEHGDAIYRLALSVVRDQALAEDVAQETLVKAWLALPTFRGDASLRSWLLRITHNTAISTLRRRRAVVVDPNDMPEQQTRVERSVESRVQGEVVMDQFVEALDTLDDLSRSIVVLRELEGLTYEEISEVLAVPMPTVKTRLLRARRRLSNVLREWA